jgi:predicted ATP-grasp superfamily ATP-dependent carboligase
MRVLIFEHVCGGGLAGGDLPPALLAAGQAMWQAVVEDFAAAGCQVLTTLDARLAPGPGFSRRLAGRVAIAAVPAPDAESSLRRQRPGSLELKRLAASCDAALLIAPETAGILEHWAARWRRWKVRSLGSTPQAIATCADKAALNDLLLRRGVPAIPGRTGDAELLLDSISHALRLMGHIAPPLAGASPQAASRTPGQGRGYVLKPRDGAGCENTFVLRCPEDVESVRALARGDGWLVQPYVPGVAASVSLIVRGKQIVTLPAGGQVIAGDRQLRYAGGELPLSRSLAQRAGSLARRAAAAVSGLQGFVGVDLLLGERAEEDVVVEINPRVTLSYCGLRKLCRTNLAKMLLGQAKVPLARRGRVAFDSEGRISEDSLR